MSPVNAPGDHDGDDPWHDEYGHRLGYCNDCGEEALLYDECCSGGEVVPYDDDPDPDE